MRPKLDFGWVELDAYTVWVALGIIAGLAVAYWYLRARSRRASACGTFLDAALVALGAGAVGARVYHLITHWDYYEVRPEQVVQLELGGLAMRGALLAGLVLLVVFARVRRLSPGLLLDACAVGLAIGQALGWVGALVQGAGYGAASDAWYALELPDLYGLVELRFPVQHAEILLFGALFAGLLVCASSQRPVGTVALVYLVVSALGNGLVGFQRADETTMLGAWRVDQVVDGMIAVGALAVWGWRGGRVRGAGDVRRAPAVWHDRV